MTPAQRAALKTDVLANSDTSTKFADGDLSGLADLYNATATPSFTVWKTLVTQDEIMQNGFDWTRVDNLSVGPARVWEWLFDNQSRAINPAKANVRAGIEAVWKGAAADLAVRASVYVHCKRQATRFEKLFATGVGSDAVPAVMTLESPVPFTEFVEL